MANNPPPPPPPPPPPLTTSDRPGDSDIYVFLVGINNYTNLRNLRGCVTDIERIESYLKWRYLIPEPETEGDPPAAPAPLEKIATNSYSLAHLNSSSTEDNEEAEASEETGGYGQLKIHRLLDEEATYDNIINGFTSFLSEAKFIDIVWFHFSGHGTESSTASEFVNRANGRDQCLLCHDYTMAADRSITGLVADKELAQLLNSIGGDQKPHIVVTLDACNSGSGTRLGTDSEFAPRGEDLIEGHRPRALADYFGYDAGDDYHAPPSHVVLTACTNLELAGDSINGGVFTQSLIQTLEENDGHLNYAKLSELTRFNVKRTRQFQTPQFEVIGDAKAYSLFLNGGPDGRPDEYEVDFELGKWIVKAGALHHLPINPDHPVTVDIFSSSNDDGDHTPLKSTTIEQVGPHFSTLALAESELSSADAPFYGIINHIPAPPVHVRLNIEDEEERQTVVDAWADTANNPQAAKAQAENVRLLLPTAEEIPFEMELSIVATDEGERYELHDLQRDKKMKYRKTELDFVIQDATKITAWYRTRDLVNDESAFKDKVSMSISCKGPGPLLIFDTSDDKVIIQADGNNHLPGELNERYFKIQPTISVQNVNKNLFFYLLYLYEDYSIESYVGHEEESFQGTSGQLEYNSNDIGLSEGEDEYTYYLKLIITSKELDIHQLLQEGVDGDRGKARASKKPDHGFDEWLVINKEIKVIREGVDASVRGGFTNAQPTNRVDHLGFNSSHAFVIGIDQYPGLEANLRNAAHDAQEIAMRLKAIQGFDNVLLMKDASRAQIRALLDWLAADNPSNTIFFPNRTGNISWLETEMPPGLAESAAMTLLYKERDTLNNTEVEKLVPLYPVSEKQISIDKTNDSVVFYFAGHGIPGEFNDGPVGFLAPSDAENRLLGNDTLIPMDEVYRALATLDCHHTLLILDCCFAGQFRFASTHRSRARTHLVPIYQRRFERYKNRRAWQVLVSSGPDQTAADSARWAGIRDHSPFASTLMRALEGRADLPTGLNRGKLQSDGVVTATELYLYVWDKVENMSSTVGKPQHPGLFRMKEDGGGEFIFFNPLFQPDQLPADPNRNPYKGLLSYEPEDSPWFFGRNEDIKNLAAKVTDNPVVVVTAPSAFGKSSVVKAGLFPYLRDKHQFELLVLRPGALPWSGEPVVSSDEENPRILYYTGLEKLKNALDPGKKQLLFVDQYEEVFTESKVAVDFQTFESELKLLKEQAAGTTIDGEGGALRIVIALRSDFEWQLESSTFGQSIWDQELINQPFLYRLGALGLNQLREALTGPAYVQAYEFEDQLEERILEDIANAPGALPLLSFTMQEFHNISSEEARQFTHDEYANKLKGVIGALRNRADHIYENELDDAQKNMLKSILLRMVQINEGQFTSRRVLLGSSEIPESLNELDFPNIEVDHLAEGVLEKMEEAHLFVRGQDENGLAYVELTHDALIAHWPRYQQWIKDFGKEQLVLQRRLWQAVTDWKNAMDKGLF